MSANNLQLSKHALRRRQQRRISKEQIETVMTHGVALPAGGGATSYHLTNQRCAELIAEHHAMIQLLQRAQGVTVIAEDAEVITEFHEIKSRTRGRRCHVYPLH